MLSTGFMFMMLHIKPSLGFSNHSIMFLYLQVCMKQSFLNSSISGNGCDFIILVLVAICNINFKSSWQTGLHSSARKEITYEP